MSEGLVFGAPESGFEELNLEAFEIAHEEIIMLEALESGSEEMILETSKIMFEVSERVSEVTSETVLEIILETS